MAYDRNDEILRRLEALERHLYQGGPHAPSEPPPPPRPPPGPPPPAFDEKRLVDLIVRLVTEQVERALDRQRREGDGGRDDRNGFDEKRVVDLFVRLVGERVDEIVARRLTERDDRSRSGG